MIRSSKHILDYQTKHKNNLLDRLFEIYRHDLELCIDDIIDNACEIPKFGSFNNENGLVQSAAYKQVIFKHASEIIRSQLKEASKRRFRAYKKLYRKCIEQNRHLGFTSKKFRDLYRKPIHKTKYFTRPEIKNLSITLDSRLIDFQDGNFFDEFVRIKLPFFEETKKRSVKICIPFKHHKHSRKFKDWNRKQSVMIYEKNHHYMLTLFYEKDIEYKSDGYSISTSVGIDQGYKKLLSCSDGKFYGTEELRELYESVARKVRGSKNYRQTLKFRDIEINRFVNEFFNDHLTLTDLYIEDLKNVKKGTRGKIGHKFMNKLQYWVYSQLVSRIEDKCEENGIHLHYVNPAYTSQTCSCCGYVDKNSRDGEHFCCQHCGFEIDADLNASINILRRGAYIPSSPKRQRC